MFVNDTVDAAVIDTLYGYGVKMIALRCAGYNNVNIHHAFGKIHVTHVPAYSVSIFKDFRVFDAKQTPCDSRGRKEGVHWQVSDQLLSV